MELTIRNREFNVECTVAKSWTAAFNQLENGRSQSMLSIAPSLRGTLDGSTFPYPSWDHIRYVSEYISMFIMFV